MHVHSVCMHVCMYIHVHVCMCVHSSLDPMHKSLGMRLCVCMCVCTHVRARICMFVYLYVCVYGGGECVFVLGGGMVMS